MMHQIEFQILRVYLNGDIIVYRKDCLAFINLIGIEAAIEFC